MQLYKWQASFPVPTAAANGYMRDCVGIDIDVWEQVEDGPSSYHWASPHLENLEDTQLASDRASALLALWHGAMIVGYGPDFPSITPGALLGRHGRIAHFSGDWEVNPFDPRLLGRPTPEDQLRLLSGSPVDTSLYLARDDDHLRHRLQSMGRHGPTGVELYKLCEFMQTRLGWDFAAIDQQGGAPSSKFTERFRATINSPDLTSLDGRHGGAAGGKPMKRAAVHADEARPVLVMAFAKAISELGRHRSAGPPIS